MLSASQCQTSTCAPARGTQPLLLIWETRTVRFNGAPSLTVPSDGSERMSERLSFSSTKYGPSVSSGRTMQEGKATLVAAVVGAVFALAAATVATCCCAVAMAVGLFAATTAVCASAFGTAAVAALVGCTVDTSPGAQAASAAALIAALAAPNSASASRRLKTRPMGRSSSG